MRARTVVLASLLGILVLVGLLWWPLGNPAQRKSGAPLIVYCAAGLKNPVERVAHEYESLFHVPIQLQYGGSGTLLSNLRVSRRGDVFIAADQSYLDSARSNKLVAEVIPLAKLTAVIAVRRGNPRNIRGLADLLRADVKVALANPDAAAIGKLVRDQLQASGEWPALERQVKVFKPTVNDVANDVKLATVDAGVIWDANVAQYPELEAIPAPALRSDRQLVALGVLEFSQHPPEALRFARYLAARDRGLTEFARNGYAVVEGDPWVERPEIVLFSGGVNRLAMETTLSRFEQREGVKITRVYNGCGILLSQIKTGQQPDAFFACDLPFLEPVRDRFGDAIWLSETDVVILAQKGNPHAIRSLADLAKNGLKVGVGNADQTALGALTGRVLREAGLFDAVMANVQVQTPTADLLVNQMRAGGLDAAVVYKANTSQVSNLLEVVPVNIPGAKAIQPFAVSRTTGHRQLVERLLRALRGAESSKHFESVGFRWLAKPDDP